MKTKAILPALLLVTMALALPTASADHGYHECTEADPCDNQGNYGCDSTQSVGCTYEAHNQCYYGINDDGENAKFCKHESKDCLVNLLDWCHLHGTVPIVPLESLVGAKDPNKELPSA